MSGATDIVAGLRGRNTAAPTVARAMGGLDQAAFLRLMTTQLTTQDPFNPVDNTQMVAQMAQFSQVAGIAEMNASLKAIAASLGPSRLSDAAGWIGRSMLVEADVATPLRDGSYAGEIARGGPWGGRSPPSYRSIRSRRSWMTRRSPSCST